MKENEYKCAICENVYKKGLSDEDANKEAKEIWGIDGASKRNDMAMICDDCFNKIHPNKHPSIRDATKEVLKRTN